MRFDLINDLSISISFITLLTLCSQFSWRNGSYYYSEIKKTNKNISVIQSKPTYINTDRDQYVYSFCTNTVNTNFQSFVLINNFHIFGNTVILLALSNAFFLVLNISSSVYICECKKCVIHIINVLTIIMSLSHIIVVTFEINIFEKFSIFRSFCDENVLIYLYQIELCHKKFLYQENNGIYIYGYVTNLINNATEIRKCFNRHLSIQFYRLYVTYLILIILSCIICCINEKIYIFFKHDKDAENQTDIKIFYQQISNKQKTKKNIPSSQSAFVSINRPIDDRISNRINNSSSRK